MSKTILAQVDGFTPCIDAIVEEHGIITAAVFGVVWRFCQMKDNTCWASQETIGKKVGLSRRSVLDHLRKLVECGYLEIADNEPGATVHYKDTGKANLCIKITGGVRDIHGGCANNAQGGVQELHTKIVIKDSIKDRKEEVEIPPAASPFDGGYYIQVYTQVTQSVGIPGSQTEAVLDAMNLLSKKYKTRKELVEYLQPFYDAWKGRRRTDGSYYSKSNCTWLTDWAITGEIPAYKTEASPSAGKDILKGIMNEGELWQRPDGSHYYKIDGREVEG